MPLLNQKAALCVSNLKVSVRYSKASVIQVSILNIGIDLRLLFVSVSKILRLLNESVSYLSLVS